MRTAVLSDIHANLEAFEAVLYHAEKREVDSYVCLGDVVGYGANPNECIEILSSLSCPCLLGNHDAAVLEIPLNMKQDSRRVINWTRQVLSKTSLTFLHQMEDVIHDGNVLYCHSNPYRPRNWYYVVEKTYISSSFARSKAKILFVGHTHVPVAITRKNFFCVYVRSPEHRTVVPVAETNRQIFNGGSIGQPRDGDSRAAYLIYDNVMEQIEFYRISYNIGRAAEKILEAGLPEIFAKRLFSGL
ncbi:MAG: putative phosphodiesterase [Desulforhopalus sp.]|jgi:predicted phosphodiesterase